MDWCLQNILNILNGWCSLAGRHNTSGIQAAPWLLEADVDTITQKEVQVRELECSKEQKPVVLEGLSFSV